MKKINNVLLSSILTSLLLVASAEVMAQGEPMYNFLPSDTVKEKVSYNLQVHGVDMSALDVKVDEQGVVRLSGEAYSKQQVETITRIVQGTEGVYGVLGNMRYMTASAMLTGLDSTMESPAAGNAKGEQSSVQ